MYCLNRIFARGQPTYEILGKKRSIIDVCLANNIRSVKEFRVLPQILGVNAQTCHKILKLTIGTRLKKESERQEKALKFRHCTFEALLKVKGSVARRMKILRLIRKQTTPGAHRSIYRYEIVSRMYRNAKKKYIGYRNKRKKIVPATLVIRTLQEKIKETNAMIEKESVQLKEEDMVVNEGIDALVNRLSILENELYKQWTVNQHRKFAKWLGKLNKLGWTTSRQVEHSLKS